MKIHRPFFKQSAHTPHEKKRTKIEKLFDSVHIEPTPEQKKNKMLIKVLKEQNPETVDKIAKAIDGKSSINEALKKHAHTTDKMEAELVRPGDVIAYFTYENPRDIDTPIRFGQWLVRPFVKGKKVKSSHAVTHLMIVTEVKDGKVTVAEATPGSKDLKPTRELDFSHKSFKLKPKEFGEYRIYRPRDENLGEKAAKVAHFLVSENKKIDTGYSKKKAVVSILKSATFSKKEVAKARKIAEEMQGSVDSEKKKSSYFCAEFVGLSYLVAEVQNKESDNEIEWRIRASRMSPQKFVKSADTLGFSEVLRIIPKV